MRLALCHVIEEVNRQSSYCRRNDRSAAVTLSRSRTMVLLARRRLTAAFVAEMVPAKASLLTRRHIGPDVKGRQALQIAIDQECASPGLTGRRIELAGVGILRLRRKIVQHC